MGNRLDLHMHSDVSNDGEFSPWELMALCSESGLRTVALTDHNSVRGIAEAKAAADRFGLGLISGIELDCQHRGVNLHLLGYGIDPAVAAFDTNELEVLGKEQAASSQLIKSVLDLGVCFEPEQVLDLAVHGVVTGEMIAEVALEDRRNANNPLLAPYRKGGGRSDNPFVNFYWDYCSQGKPAYVPIEFISLLEAIQLIKGAGGLAVLAHPGKNIGRNPELLQSIIASGIDGIEVYSSYHDSATIAFYDQQAENHRLLKSVGSDFHGKTKPSIKLGKLDIPQERMLEGTIISKLDQMSIT